jgi:hypothetical protein
VPYVLRESAPTAFTIEQVEALSRCRREKVVVVLQALIADGKVEVEGSRVRWVTLK